MHYFSYRTPTPSAECHRNPVVWIKRAKIGRRGNVLESRERSKDLFQIDHLQPWFYLSIGPVDVAIIGPTKLVENKKQQQPRAKQVIAPWRRDDMSPLMLVRLAAVRGRVRRPHMVKLQAAITPIA